MKPKSNKLQHREQEVTEEQQHAQEKVTEKTLETVEDLLRHDLHQIEVPASIERRLALSIGSEKPSWWRRLFSKANR
jgi:hypothetical protein